MRRYWDIDRIIDEQGLRDGWGAADIARLAPKLKYELPDLRGILKRNIKLM